LVILGGPASRWLFTVVDFPWDELLHRERAGLPRVDFDRRTGSPFAHQRVEARHERRELLG
jgi:hypothetical protein